MPGNEDEAVGAGWWGLGVARAGCLIEVRDGDDDALNLAKYRKVLGRGKAKINQRKQDWGTSNAVSRGSCGQRRPWPIASASLGIGSPASAVFSVDHLTPSHH